MQRCIAHRPHAKGQAKTLLALGDDLVGQKTAQRLSVAAESIRAEFKKTAKPKNFTPEPSAEEPLPESEQAETSLPPDREFWLLRFLLQHDEQMDWVVHHLDLHWLQHPDVRRILAARVSMHADQTWRGVPSLLDVFEDEAARNLITEAAAEEHPTADLGRNIVATVLLLRNDFYDRQLAELKIKLAQPDLPEPEQHRILQQQAELRQAKHQPLMPMGEA